MAARPMPGAACMVSSISSMRSRISSVTASTGAETRFSNGSGRMMSGRTAIWGFSWLQAQIGIPRWLVNARLFTLSDSMRALGFLLTGLEEIANFGQQAFAGGRFGRRSGFLLALEPVDRLDDQEQHPGDDHEI